MLKTIILLSAICFLSGCASTRELIALRDNQIQLERAIQYQQIQIDNLGKCVKILNEPGTVSGKPIKPQLVRIIREGQMGRIDTTIDTATWITSKRIDCVHGRNYVLRGTDYCKIIKE